IANVEVQHEWEMEELLRLFYVAVTRGKEQLIVGPMDSKSKKGLAQWLDLLPFQEEKMVLDGQFYDKKAAKEPAALELPTPQLKKPTLSATHLLNQQLSEPSSKVQTQARGHVIGLLIHEYAQVLEGYKDNGALDEILMRSPVRLSASEEMRVRKLAAHYQHTLLNEEVVARELPFLLDMDSFNLRGTIDQIRKRD